MLMGSSHFRENILENIHIQMRVETLTESSKLKDEPEKIVDDKSYLGEPNMQKSEFIENVSSQKSDGAAVPNTFHPNLTAQ